MWNFSILRLFLTIGLLDLIGVLLVCLYTQAPNLDGKNREFQENIIEEKLQECHSIDKNRKISMVQKAKNPLKRRGQ